MTKVWSICLLFIILRDQCNSQLSRIRIQGWKLSQESQLCIWNYQNKKKKKVEILLTSSQISASSSADLCFALSRSIIESKGFCFNGVKPEANFDVRTEPSERHFKKSLGIASRGDLSTICGRIELLYGCLEAIEKEEKPFLYQAKTEESVLFDTLRDKWCIVIYLQ